MIHDSCFTLRTDVLSSALPLDQKPSHTSLQLSYLAYRDLLDIMDISEQRRKDMAVRHAKLLEMRRKREENAKNKTGTQPVSRPTVSSYSLVEDLV
jgi:hypothetical protein